MKVKMPGFIKKLISDRKEKLQYSNCWEDVSLLLEALSIQEGQRMLSIAAAGDSSFSLLTKYPEEVIAIDQHDPQLYLVELKKMAIKHLNYSEVLEFLGFLPCQTRIKYYQYLKGWLSYKAQMHWQRHLNSIKEGIIFQGEFEKYFSFFAKKILPMIHSSELIEEMLLEKSPQAQQYFYYQHWNSLKWRLFFKLFFNKNIMGKFSRSIDFEREVNIPVEDYIFQQTERHLSSVYAAHNPFLRFALTGTFGQELPHYLKPENFETIKQNINHLQVKKSSIKDIFKQEKPFDFFNLSHIFDKTSAKSFERIAKIFALNSRKNTHFAYWNFIQGKRLSEAQPNYFHFQQDISRNLRKKDQGFFYRKLTLETKT